MSRTDKDRPYHVRAYDHVVKHSSRSHGEGVCDAHLPDTARDYRCTACRPYTHPTNRTAARKLGKKTRIRVDRAITRATSRELLRAANSGALEDAEYLVGRRTARRFPPCGCCF